MENEKGIVKLTRKQLYDEIWAVSVAGVARKYNLKRRDAEKKIDKEKNKKFVL